MNVIRTTMCVAAIAGIVASVAAVASRGAGVRAASSCASGATSNRRAHVRLRTDAETGEGVAVDLLGVEPEILRSLRAARMTEAQWAAAFDVRVAAADSTLPSIAGRYAFAADTLRFVPAYPLLAGESYRVRAIVARGLAADCDVDRIIVDTTIEVAKVPHGGRSEVTAVFPTVDVLPMNQLKLYVHFSAPMRTGEAAAHARIIDETDGRTVPDAFYNFEDELWDPSQTRLTLLFDPGRIKRGLRPHEELGLPLRAGHRYRLVIDRAWRDASGDSLQRGFVKRFSVVAPDRVAPRVASWSMSEPRAGSLDALTLSFGEPMDEALLERLLVVRDSDGTSVAGHSFVEAGEDHWRFVPDTPWRDRKYVIDVGTDLEDLAGNNLRRPFDRDLRDHTGPALEQLDHVSLPIVIRPAKRR